MGAHAFQHTAKDGLWPCWTGENPIKALIREILFVLVRRSYGVRGLDGNAQSREAVIEAFILKNLC